MKQLDDLAFLIFATLAGLAMLIAAIAGLIYVLTVA